MKCYWTEQEATLAASMDELLEFFADVKNIGHPTMVFLEHDNGRMLVIGLGSSESVLTFVESDGASFHSVGDTSRSGVLRFWCRDQLDEFMVQMAIPESLAIDAARSFFVSGVMPSNVIWEADW
ncbi:Imm1 family immunity protein [Sorangium sp. So ce1153]|uniref:Imm1 family immunity protein n=1 Tax=Sorangium sp. So ce1153 TaxID=3133333 RepID=UPI003F646AAA